VEHLLVLISRKQTEQFRKRIFQTKLVFLTKNVLKQNTGFHSYKDTGYISEKSFESMISDADEIGKILFSILKKTRINK
jgi:hypothetical protein